MIFAHTLFCLTIVTCNLVTAYNQNNHPYFQANITLNAPNNPYKQSKPAVRLSYGGCKYISEPFRPPVGVGISHKKSSKKQTAQKNTGQLNSAQKAALQTAITKRISEVSKSYQANFDAMYPTMYQSLQQFVLNPAIKQSDVEHALTYQMMHHLITTNQTNHGIITRYQQHPWAQNKDISKASQEEKIMVNYMLNCMVRAENNTTIELAQAALQEWIQAQNAQSPEECESHIKKCNNYYRSMQHKTPTQSIWQQAKPVKKADIEDLLQNYTAIIENNHSNTILDTKSTDAYTSRIEKRAQVLIESKEQLRTNKLVHHTYEMSLDARGFLMANNMNYAAFDAVSVTSFQHCLTQEILDIIESSVGMVQRNGCQSIIAQLAYHNCNLAISAQQLNQLSHIKQAAAVTDLSHFFALYGRSILDDELEAQAWIALGSGMYDGATKVLYKWHEFAKKLGHRDTRSQTVRDVAHDCYQVGKMFYHILKQCNEFNPLAYLDDMTKDIQDATDRIFTHDDRDEDDLLHHPSRMAQRQQRNLQSLQNGLSSAVNAGTAVIHSMLAKTCKENIADMTEFSLDAIMYGKITDAVVAISKIGASQCFTTSRSFLQQISQGILDDTLSFATSNNGELLAIATTSGENISAALASATQIFSNTAGPIFKYAAQAKILSDKIEEITKPNKQEVEALKKSIEPYLRTDMLLPGLADIKGVRQIENFREITKNFTTIERLTEHEILYLNACNWLYPQAIEINNKVRSLGLKIFDVEIKEFGLFHSLLGDMKPGCIETALSGGHLLITDIKSVTHIVENIMPLNDGYFDAMIKHIKSIGNAERKTFFPCGKSPEQCVDIIIDAIQNPKFIKQELSNNLKKKIFNITNQENQIFTLYVENGRATFHRSNPLKK